MHTIKKSPTFALQNHNGVLAHLARARHWQCRGERFESAVLHHHPSGIRENLGCRLDYTLPTQNRLSAATPGTFELGGSTCVQGRAQAVSKSPTAIAHNAGKTLEHCITPNFFHPAIALPMIFLRIFAEDSPPRQRVGAPNPTFFTKRCY